MNLSKALFHDMPKPGIPPTAIARWTGILIVVALATTGFVVGSQTYLDHQHSAEFYQDRFDVAVSIACTGHIDELFGNSQVDTFLKDRSGELKSCDGVDAARSKRWTDFDASTLYLYVLASLAWAFLGFSWSSLWVVAGVFAAGLAVGAYLFIRCFTSSRIVAAGLALAVLFAPPVLGQIPNLRDFSKAPPILMGLGLIGRAVFSAIGPRRAIYLAASAGAMIGLGAGLRPDVVLLAPVALATFVLLQRGGEGARGRVKPIATALFALFVGYLVAGAPVATVNATKHATTDDGAHVQILGFAERFQDALGFERRNYALLRDYADEQAEVLVNLYHSGVGVAHIRHYDLSYGPQSYEVLTGMLTATPHDALMRVFAAANAVGAYPINNLVYGPVLVLLLVAGFIVLPRLTLFYCISASVIVPTLSLQFASRHAFYVVVFGAAALGLAYTLAATASVALINRNVVDWPSRAQILRRAVMLGGSTATLVSLVYAADALAKDRQERALVALYDVYHNANWSPIEVVHDDVGVTFPTLTSTGRTVGLMALSFAFDDPDSIVSAVNDLNWRITGSAQMTRLDEGFRIATNGERGYQLRSRRIEIGELSGPGAESASGTLSLRVRGTAASAGWSIGVLSHDDSKWVAVVPLPAGVFDRRVTVRIPPTEPAVHLIWASDAAGASSVDVNLFVVSNKAEVQGCTPSPWSITPLHRYGDAALGTPVPIPVATSGTYYFPFARLPKWMLESVRIDGALSRCIKRVQIVQSLPPHTVAIELIEIDGAFHPTQRLSWRTMLAGFARWHRPAHY